MGVVVSDDGVHDEAACAELVFLSFAVALTELPCRRSKATRARACRLFDAVESGELSVAYGLGAFGLWLHRCPIGDPDGGVEVMRKSLVAVMAAGMVLGAGAPMATADEIGHTVGSVNTREPRDLVRSWGQKAKFDSLSRAALSRFRQLPPRQQNTFLALVQDPSTWDKATSVVAESSVSGVRQIKPGVVVEATFSSVSTPVTRGAQFSSLNSSAARYWNVTSTSRFDFKILGIKLGHWKQEYGYKTKSGRYAIVSSDWCNGWWTGFAGFWNISSRTNHYKSGSFGYCKTLHTGSLVYKGAFITMNKEHGQKVAGPDWISAWLKNV